jgi:hypothetical protein
MAAGADPTSATPEQVQEAQTHFLKGRDLANQNKFDEALAEFRASYDAVASPNARLSIARTLQSMGKLVDAWVEFGHAIDEGNSLAAKEARYGETAKAAQEERTKVEEQIGFVPVTVANAPADATVTVAGAAVDNAALAKPIPVMPGSVDVVVQSGGTAVAKQTVQVGAGQKQTVSLDAAPPKATPTPPPAPTSTDASDNPDWQNPADRKKDKGPIAPSGNTKLRPFAYVAGGVGAAGILTFAIFGLMEKSAYSGLQSDCPNNVCPPGKANDISSGKTDQTIANIGLAVGVLGLAAGATLFVLSMPKSSSATQSASAPRPSLLPSRAELVVSPGWIGLRGTL